MWIDRLRTEDGKLRPCICSVGWPGWLLRWHMRRVTREKPRTFLGREMM